MDLMVMSADTLDLEVYLGRGIGRLMEEFSTS
jgi:hypothetical protein